jgi:hypothetical protein
MWSFNGPDYDSASTTAEVLDKSGQGNNGDAINGPTLTGGKVGQALKFDGVNDHVIIPDSNVFTMTNGYTISSWVKLAATTTNSTEFISQWGSGGAGNASWSFDITSSRFLSILNYNGTTPSSLTDDTTQLALNIWYHVTGVYTGGTSGTNALIYVNGALVKSGTISVVPQNSGYNVYLGRSAVMGGTNYFPGIMDEVRIYNQPLSAGEIKQLYNLGR